MKYSKYTLKIQIISLKIICLINLTRDEKLVNLIQLELFMNFKH